MEAKEKAIELVAKMHREVNYSQYENAINCAKITVDEVIKHNENEGIVIGNYFWKQVKQELEKL